MTLLTHTGYYNEYYLWGAGAYVAISTYRIFKIKNTVSVRSVNHTDNTSRHVQKEYSWKETHNETWNHVKRWGSKVWNTMILIFMLTNP